jgi:hypothetical protein
VSTKEFSPKMPETGQYTINYIKRRMAQILGPGWMPGREDPALNYVRVGDAGARASKALFDTVPNVKDSPKS